MNDRKPAGSSYVGWTNERGLVVLQVKLPKPWLLLVLAGLSLATAPVLAIEPQCDALGRRAAKMLDGQLRIEKSSAVAAQDDLPAYCKVEGIIEPQIGFELRLPLTGWNGKYLQQGCGGMCGWINMGACEDALARGYATANTDMGHKGSPAWAGWAWRSPQARVDFAYRSTHLLAKAGKALVESFYGKPPAYAYFRGCSTGGRQGLIEAQRYPDDFDGIIAGAPVLNQFYDGLYHLAWSGLTTLDAGGKPILTTADLKLANQSAMAACDKTDGVVDGVIGDPPRCGWTPARLACGTRRSGACLSPDKVAALQRLYAGYPTQKAVMPFSGGLTPGGETEWVPIFVTPDGSRPPVLNAEGMLPRFFAYLGLQQDKPVEMTNLDVEALALQLAEPEAMFNAQSADLAAFKRAGGKLILYHGWNDIEVPPGLSTAYFDSVAAVQGGRAATLDFFRLFMLPGIAHCRRGSGADAIDFLTALENWVEKGEAPDRLIAHHLVKEQNYLGLPRLRFPLQPADYAWTRPVYPYPVTATWSGAGDWRDAARWRPRNANKQ